MSYTGPYTNFHEINLNLFIRALKKLKGGLGGQSLVKKSNVEYDYEWKTLTAQDVGALPDSYIPPVTSVNGKTGAVELDAQDVGALPDSYIPPVTSVNGKTGVVVLDSSDIGFNESTVYNALINALPTDIATGNPASFPDGAYDIPVKSLTVNIDPVQSGSGNPSPDNIRPLSGWTGLTLNVSGADTTSPTTYEVDWTDEAGTVYGGTLDMTTGVLTVDRLAFVFDGTQTWSSQFSGDNNCFRFTITNLEVLSDFRACSHYANAIITSGNTAIGYYAYTSGNSTRIQIRPDHSIIPIGDIAAWSAWIATQYAAGTPLTCVVKVDSGYERTYQLDPVTVRTLLGLNNVWAGTGDVTVEYVANTKLYIDKQIGGA